jgi:DNA-directed RNA polymerase alpha subunit/DNA-directed RNA polymerase subunit L
MFEEYKEKGHPLLGSAEGAKLNATVRLTRSNVTMANTLRRSILSLTPSVAFPVRGIAIHHNTTPIPNEMLELRIGLIPIRANPVTFEPDLYEFRLDKTNTGLESMDIFASDIEVWRKDPMGEPVQLETRDFFPPDPVTKETVLITRLQPQWNPVAPNQRLAFTSRATVSNGTEDARFSPVAACAYGYTRDPSEEKEAAVKKKWLRDSKKIYVTEGLAREQIAALGDKIVKWEELDPEKRGELDREYKTMEIQRCYLTDERGEPNDFTFQLESVGIQPLPAIGESGLSACEALVAKYQDLDATLPDNVQLQVADTRFPAIDLLFQYEGHTLGNLLETYLGMNHVTVEGVAEGKAEPKLSYVAYKVPHPLKAEMVLRIGCLGGSETPVETQKQIARSAVSVVCRNLKDQFRALKESWMRATSA